MLIISICQTVMILGTVAIVIQLTETIKQSLDQGLFSCDIFVDLQKAFDTVDNDFLLGKLELYGQIGITNKWFETYLKVSQQFVSINDYNSECASLPIGDLNLANEHSKVHHFADHTNLLYTNSSIKN